LLETIEKYYPLLREDLKHAGKYLNRENLKLLADKQGIWRDIVEDIDSIEKILKILLDPEKPRHFIHRNLTSNVYQRLFAKDCPKEKIERDIVEAGIIRRSLG